MPTAYTNSVQKGKTTDVKDFILSCATQFGALSHMRDDNILELKYAEPDDYYLSSLNDAKEKFNKLLNATNKEIETKLDADYEQKLIEREESLIKFDIEKKRCLEMLEKVKLWKPPTSEHINLKNFAIEQLSLILREEYNDDLRKCREEMPEKLSVEKYREEKLKDYMDDIEYYTKEHEEDMDSVEKSNKWIKELIISFK